MRRGFTLYMFFSRFVIPLRGLHKKNSTMIRGRAFNIPTCIYEHGDTIKLRVNKKINCSTIDADCAKSVIQQIPTQGTVCS
jgi:hypothetical protein